MRKQWVTENGADWRLPSIRELTTMALYPETPDLTSEFEALKRAYSVNFGLAHPILPIQRSGFLIQLGLIGKKVVHHNHFGVFDRHNFCVKAILEDME